MSVKNINADELHQMIRAGGVEIVDVREQSEYDEIHFKNSKLIPMGEVENRLAEIDWQKPVVIICRSGGRSRVVGEYLSTLGRDVYNLENGIIESSQGNTREDLES